MYQSQWIERQDSEVVGGKSGDRGVKQEGEVKWTLGQEVGSGRWGF